MKSASRGAIVLLLVGFGGACQNAHAQGSFGDTPGDAAERARQVVLRFMDAVNAGDRRALDELIYVRTENRVQSRGRAAVIKCIEQQRALERAVAARWGENAAKEFGGAFMSFTPADRAAVEKARIDVREREEVHVITGPNVAPIVLRHGRSDGQLQVVLRGVIAMVDGGGMGRPADDGTKPRMAYLDRVQQALSYVAKRVSDKQVETPAAARKELDDAMRRAAELKDVATEPAAGQ
jgi:hypothetical protein